MIKSPAVKPEAEVPLRRSSLCLRCFAPYKAVSGSLQESGACVAGSACGKKQEQADR